MSDSLPSDAFDGDPKPREPREPGPGSSASAGPPPEGPEIEWKERLPRSERVARTLGAFANGVGGALWVGVRDDGRLLGVSEPTEVIRALRRIAAEMLTPGQAVAVQRHRVGGCTLVEARILATTNRPVLSPGRDGQPTAFVRDGASTRRAERGVLRSWARTSTRASLDSSERRVLRELRVRSRFDQPGPTVAELARLARMGQRGTRRIVVKLEQNGLVMDRGGGRYGLTPEGHRRAFDRSSAFGT